MAYQVAFDLYENATQQFLSIVSGALQASVPFVSGVSTENKVEKNGSIDKDG
jgi:hypothetical protein